LELCYNIIGYCNRGNRFLEGLELAHKVVDIVSDKQATDTVLLDVREICGFADYFVICNGESIRQVKAIIDAISQELKKDNIKPLREEGKPESGWILLDFGDVIVHVFSAIERDYYQLDKFWEKASTKVRMP
jgi:ribosome-associated protein